MAFFVVDWGANRYNHHEGEWSGEPGAAATLEDIPNVGLAIADDLRQLGITSPGELLGRDPYELYNDLCRLTGQRHDPCLLDTFIAAVRFMHGESKKPWWNYTAELKRELAARLAGQNGPGLPAHS
jgi:Pathogenicity locus